MKKETWVYVYEGESYDSDGHVYHGPVNRIFLFEMLKQIKKPLGYKGLTFHFYEMEA